MFIVYENVLKSRVETGEERCLSHLIAVLFFQNTTRYTRTHSDNEKKNNTKTSKIEIKT